MCNRKVGGGAKGSAGYPVTAMPNITFSIIKFDLKRMTLSWFQFWWLTCMGSHSLLLSIGT